MKIRSYSWGEANLSWSVVIEELLHAAEKQGHEVSFISTNGTAGMRYWNEKRSIEALVDERRMKNGNIPYDIDITFTVPQNFPERFLANSRYKMAIYDYESSHMPAHWRKFYKLVNFVLPATNYVADMFRRNGCPEEKIRVLPHGVDLDLFNPNIRPLQLSTEKKFKFLCVAAPHYRKQLDRLLRAYCGAFTAADDVSLILKTQLFKPGDQLKGFEMDLKPVVAELNKKHGKNMPEVQFIRGRLNNMGSLYTACNAFCLMTASEGFGVPFLEALACGLPVIAPRHGGQLDFLNDDNAFLSKCGTRRALPQEQYWGVHPNAITGKPDEVHFVELMQSLVQNYEVERARLLPFMQKTAQSLSWDNVAKKLIEIVRQND